MKNKSIKATLLLVLALTWFTTASAQELTVKGRLIDSASSKPVALASINFQEVERKISRTIVSDASGVFQTRLSAGRYKMMITHSSFRKKGMPLKVEAKDVEMGNIQLVPAIKSLDGVTVTATRPMVEQQADKLIYNAEDDPAAKSESASDILRKTPYVNVDGDGGVQVNGQSNFKVLLDGRETAMFSQNVKEALKAFPGATIARIEVITSPSAKYDAEGLGGIINIITKKKVAGYSGSVNSNITTLGHKSAGMNINLKTGRLGIAGTYNFNTNGGISSHQLGITTPANPIAFVKREVGGERFTDMQFHQASLEFSYDLDSLNTIVAYGNMSRMRNKTLNENEIYTLFSNGNTDLSPYNLDTRFAVPTHGFGSDYIRKFKKPQKEFSIRFAAMYHTNETFANSQQKIFGTDRFILNNSEAFNSEYTLQADWVEPLNKTTKVETGVKTILRKASSDFESQVKFNKAEPYVTDPFNSNKFSYDQNVYGGYVSLNKVTKLITFRVGLRVEHTTVDGDFTSTKTIVQQRYTNLVPNLMLSKQFNKSFSSNLTYNFRLGRPSIQSLNPFVNNSDSLNISYGNPNLGPQYTHMIAWQNKLFKGNRFVSVQAGFNFSNNLIIQNPKFDAATGITAVTSDNVGQLREFTLGFVSNVPVGKWTIAVNATGRLASMRNSTQSSFATYTAGNVNGNFTYKATSRFTIASHTGYFVPLRTPNNTFPENYFYGLNFSYKMFNQKLTLTANLTNFFEQERKLRFVTENDYFVMQNVNTIPFRNFGVSLNYSFGKLKENVTKKKGVNNDDVVE